MRGQYIWLYVTYRPDHTYHWVSGRASWPVSVRSCVWVNDCVFYNDTRHSFYDGPVGEEVSNKPNWKPKPKIEQRSKLGKKKLRRWSLAFGKPLLGLLMRRNKFHLQKFKTKQFENARARAGPHAEAERQKQKLRKTQKGRKEMWQQKAALPLHLFMDMSWPQTWPESQLPS